MPMARGLNKVMVIGHLGRDPEMRYTPTGKSVTNFCVASNRSWQSADGKTHTETDWFNVVAWGKLAEISKQHLHKGSLVYVEGRLQSRTWQDNQGQQRKSMEIIARDILMLSDKQKDDNIEAEGCEDYENNYS
jgi:single-strand DNA-binding protein